MAKLTRARTRADASGFDDQLALPKGRGLSGPKIDVDAFGRVSESIARYFGTAQYLAIQTIVVIVWIIINAAAVTLRWDPYPFILLNLAFSTQAAYAAPLILLAQNRQESRDKASMDEDRQRAVANKADTEFIARELAALRLSIGELATRDFVRSELQKLIPPDSEDDAKGRPTRP